MLMSTDCMLGHTSCQGSVSPWRTAGSATVIVCSLPGNPGARSTNVVAKLLRGELIPQGLPRMAMLTWLAAACAERLRTVASLMCQRSDHRRYPTAEGGFLAFPCLCMGARWLRWTLAPPSSAVCQRLRVRLRPRREAPGPRGGFVLCVSYAEVDLI
jgi:hypothetical protein